MAKSKKTIATKSKNKKITQGVKSSGVHTGAIDSNKIYKAKRIPKQALIGSSGLDGSRTAGMMMNNTPLSHGSHFSNSSLDAYQSSYANGMNAVGGMRDIPVWFQMMNEKNGGTLYWPVSLREKYEMYRYFTRSDAYCGRAIELLTNLPMSKITLNMPKMDDKELRDEIFSFYEGMVDKLGLFKILQFSLSEYNIIGNVLLFHEWNPEQKSWEKIAILPPEEVSIFHYPFSDDSHVEYRPERLLSIIKQFSNGGLNVNDNNEDNISYEAFKEIPQQVVDMVNEKGYIEFDTDPYSGSFLYHMARDRSPYQDLGVSVLERVYVPMLMKEHFRYTQLGLASRNMTPKNKISADKLSIPELADLRAQLDLSYLDPDFSIVTNYPWEWEQLGAGDRLLDLGGEYEIIENQIFAGLGVTRELLTGEGVYSGTKITIEILNTMFMNVREMLQDYVEKQLFRPVAEAHGWFTTDKHGMKRYLYPKLGFNRLSIRDNQEIFDSFFQLYQKGSLPVDIIYELFNLNVDEIHDRIYADLFTVKDPTFNRVMEETGQEIGRQLVEKTDILPRVSKYLRLHKVDEKGNALKDIYTDEQILTPAELQQKNRVVRMEKKKIFNQPEMKEFNSNDVDELADQIVNNVSKDATPEELEKIIDQSVDKVIK